MPTPNDIRAFELKLKANWSSENVVPRLTPQFVESVLLMGFAALEPTTKVRHRISAGAPVLKGRSFTSIRRGMGKTVPALCGKHPVVRKSCT